MRYKLALPLLFVALNSGCYSWRAESLPPAQVFASRRPAAIRFGQAGAANDRKIILWQPRLDQDSVRGSMGQHGLSAAFPMSGLVRLETRHFNAGKAVRSFAITVGVAGTAFVVITCIVFCGLNWDNP